jgi:hypothetical protein
MWLTDFLPHDVKKIRVMTFGYDTAINGAQSRDIKLDDYRRELMQLLNNAR